MNGSLRTDCPTISYHHVLHMSHSSPHSSDFGPSDWKQLLKLLFKQENMIIIHYTGE